MFFDEVVMPGLPRPPGWPGGLATCPPPPDFRHLLGPIIHTHPHAPLHEDLLREYIGEYVTKRVHFDLIKGLWPR